MLIINTVQEKCYEKHRNEQYGLSNKLRSKILNTLKKITTQQLILEDNKNDFKLHWSKNNFILI